jgi:hypothetical protein
MPRLERIGSNVYFTTVSWRSVGERTTDRERPEMRYKHDTDVVISGIMITISRYSSQEILHLRLGVMIYYCPLHLMYRNERRPIRLKLNLYMRHTEFVKQQIVRFACCV